MDMDFLGDLMDLVSSATDPIVEIVARNLLTIARAGGLTDFGQVIALALLDTDRRPRLTLPNFDEREETEPNRRPRLTLPNFDEREETETNIVFHHYTDKESAKKIMDSRIIKQSQGAVNAQHGDGVYGTPLGPDNGRKRLAENNYGELWRIREDSKKLECVIRLKLRKNQDVKTVTAQDRKIYLYDGDLSLDEAEEVDFIYYDSGKKLRIQKWK